MDQWFQPIKAPEKTPENVGSWGSNFPPTSHSRERAASHRLVDLAARSNGRLQARIPVSFALAGGPRSAPGAGSSVPRFPSLARRLRTHGKPDPDRNRGRDLHPWWRSAQPRSGLRQDAEKYLEAVLAGWTVIRLTERQLELDFIERIVALLNTPRGA